MHYFQQTQRLGASVPRLRNTFALRLVFTQGTPPRVEGCRPASWGFSLALMT